MIMVGQYPIFIRNKFGALVVGFNNTPGGCLMPRVVR